MESGEANDRETRREPVGPRGLLTSRDAVLEAIREYDELGGPEFLRRYGFGPALTWRLVHEGRTYDSKAIVGAAVGKQHPERGPLTSQDFSGGLRSSVEVLRRLGFTVESDEGEASDGASFILSQKQTGSSYGDEEGRRYGWTTQSSGSSRKLAECGTARFVYYRPGAASDGTSRSYFGHGLLSDVVSSSGAGGVTEYSATISGYQPFDTPVPFSEGPPRNAQNSIATIDRVAYDELIRKGAGEDLTPRHAVVVYVGQQALGNLEVGIEAGTWGFVEMRPAYDQLRPGDSLILASGQTGGGVRVSAEEWRRHSVDRVVVGTLTSGVTVASDPLWPDERTASEVKYPARLTFQLDFERSEVSLSADGELAVAGEALRLSALSRGSGRIVDADAVPLLSSLVVSPVNPPDPPSAEALSTASTAFTDAVARTGLSFPEGLPMSVLAALSTKRFAILTGLSGSGKTQIALKLGQWFGRDQYHVTPVRPDWTGPEMLFGFEDALQATTDGGAKPWFAPATLRFMLKAASDPSKPYLLILDEMNLAHVERYFADFLSGLESGEGVLPNLMNRGSQWLPAEGRSLLPVPANLFVVGTVNVDETTYMFSPKVLDRANTFEFRVTTETLDPRAKAPAGMAAALPDHLDAVLGTAMDDDWHLRHPPDGLDEYTRRLQDLHRGLAATGNEFGHRVFFEAIRFAGIYCSTGGNLTDALDRQVVQKVLPRMHGTRRQIESPLRAVKAFCSAQDDGPLRGPLPISLDKVSRMLDRMERSQFTSFTE